MQRFSKFLIILSIVWMLFLPSCVTTPEGLVRVDPNAMDAMLQGGEAAGGILTLLSPFFPWLGPVATGVIGVIGALKVQKPKLVKAQTKQKMYHTVASSAVLAIDAISKTNPELTAAVLLEMESVKDKIISPTDRVKVENVIRALRGKPAKEEAA